MRTIYAAVIAASFWRSGWAVFAPGCTALCCLITLISPVYLFIRCRAPAHCGPLPKLEHSVLNAPLTKNFALKPNALLPRAQALWTA